MISRVWNTFPDMAHTLLCGLSERPGMNEQITKGAKFRDCRPFPGRKRQRASWQAGRAINEPYGIE